VYSLEHDENKVEMPDGTHEEPAEQTAGDEWWVGATASPVHDDPCFRVSRSVEQVATESLPSGSRLSAAQETACD
jgi:hypothetical protein